MIIFIMFRRAFGKMFKGNMSPLLERERGQQAAKVSYFFIQGGIL
jgi:hypothetical protein